MTNTMKTETKSPLSTEMADRLFRASGTGKMLRFVADCLRLQGWNDELPLTCTAEMHGARPQFVFRGSKFGSENGRHSLGIAVTSPARLLAHWEGYALQNGYSQADVDACKEAAFSVVARLPFLLSEALS